MKTKKSLYRNWAVRLLLFLAPILILTACTKNFEEINSQPDGLKELSSPDLRSLFPGSIVNGVGAGYNETSMLLFPGVYSQHFAGTNINQESHRYVIVQRWQDIWPLTYVRVMPPLVNIIKATKGKEPSMNAIARIWKVFAFLRVTDEFGPIPYSKIGLDTAAIAGGVMTSVTDAAIFKTSADFPNGLNNFMGRNGSRMSTTMESLLVGYNDPRLPVFWSPALSDGKFRGVRNGMSVAQQNMSENSINNNSAVGPKYNAANMNTTPQAVFYTSEAYFLRAEGALNGWNMGGTAKDMYEKGIETSMREHDITNAGTISAYINGTSLPSAPISMFPTPPLTDIPVKFESTVERQREQIGTQKWIALFPESHEAWANIRRTGYPKFYPLLNSQNPDITPDKMIRRISFLDREIIANGPAVKAAVPMLGGGPDNVATRLWWDKSKSK